MTPAHGPQPPRRAMCDDGRAASRTHEGHGARTHPETAGLLCTAEPSRQTELCTSAARRYWQSGRWRCKACSQPVRFAAGSGWIHLNRKNAMSLASNLALPSRRASPGTRRARRDAILQKLPIDSGLPGRLVWHDTIAHRRFQRRPRHMTNRALLWRTLPVLGQ